MIPRRFTILAHKIEVTFDSPRCHREGILGLFDGKINTIILADRKKDKQGRWIKIPQDVITHTYYHELVHCLMYYMGQTALYNNERFVDAAGGLLHQIETTKEYETDTSNRKFNIDDPARDNGIGDVPADSTKTRSKKRRSPKVKNSNQGA